ncbi:MAG TPA: ABC transporter substrate-binding protein [Candidatus Angelobacter sp.]|nr:ABC transporter substrate-binding protein [Candidatus Angelobacter sp.]
MTQYPTKFAAVLAGIFLCFVVSIPKAAAQSAHLSPAKPFSDFSSLFLISDADASFINGDGGVRVTRLQSKASVTAPGVAATTLTLGSLEPAHGANADAGDAVKAVLTAYFDELNQRGGIYNRRITVRFADAGLNRTATVKNATQLLHQPVFALVAPFAPGAENDLAGLAHEKKVPLAGLLALSVPDDPANREVFYLLPGFEQLVQELGRFAVQHQNVVLAKSAVIFSDKDLQHELGPAMQAMWKESGTALPAEYVSQENSDQQVAQLKEQGIDTVFIFGASDAVTPWIQAADAAKWYPKIFMLGPLLDDSVLTGPAPLQGRMFAVYPALEPNLEGLTEFDHFLERHNLSGEHRLLLISAYCAAQTLEAALKRAGKDLTREKFLLALEQLHDFRTGLLPPITFGPDRHIGSHKAEFVCVDLLTHSFETTCSQPASGK